MYATLTICKYSAFLQSEVDIPTQTEMEDLPTLSAETRTTVTIPAAQTSTETSSSSSSQFVPNVYPMLSLMTFMSVLVIF
jgi:hypothetical protein